MKIDKLDILIIGIVSSVLTMLIWCPYIFEDWSVWAKFVANALFVVPAFFVVVLSYLDGDI